MSDAPTKRCPYCAEETMIEAIKCKHCGERLDVSTAQAQIQSPQASAPPASTAFSPTPPPASRVHVVRSAIARVVTKHKKPLVASAILIIAAFSFTRTDMWVRLHSDVEWNRSWQDAHVEKERARVLELYEKRASSDPTNGDLRYLSIRPLPEGWEQLAAFQQAAAQFPSNPWIQWGYGRALSDADKLDDSWDTQTHSLELFPKGPPDAVLELLIEWAREHPKAAALTLFRNKHPEYFQSAVALRALAVAEFNRGNQDEGITLEKQALAAGAQPFSPSLEAQAKIMKSIGVSARIIGNADEKGGELVALKDFRFSEDSQGYLAEFWVIFENKYPNASTVFMDKFELTSDKGGLKPSRIGYWDIGARAHIVIYVPFHVPYGNTLFSLDYNDTLKNFVIRL